MYSGKKLLLSNVTIFFLLLLISPLLSDVFAFSSDSFTLLDGSEENDTTNPLIYDSNIIDVDSNFFAQNNFKRYLIFGSNFLSTNVLEKNSIHDVHSDHGFFYVSVLPEKTASSLIAAGYNVIEDSKLDFHKTPQIISDVSRIGDITGSTAAKSKYNATGSDVVIAIVDTGVDFSNLDIQHSLARDESNYPLMLDPDGQGIILTNSTFYANISKYDTIRNYTKPIFDNMTSSVYLTRDGAFLDIFQKGEGTVIQVYNSLFPQFGNSVIFNGTLSNDMKIGNDHRNFIKSKSGVYHLGVMYQGGLDKIQVVPVLVVDSIISGIYDTVIPDLSTSYQDYTNSNSTDFDYSYDFDFTDDTPIVLGSGDEFLVYDSDGDGKNDYSAGTFGAKS